MSQAINFIQNSPSIPSYSSRQQHIHSAERQIAQIDRKIGANNQLISALEKNQALRIEHLNTLKESKDLQVTHLNTLKESQGLLQESRDISQRIIGTLEQLLVCYEKLLEIRRAKNSANDTVATVPQKLQNSSVSASNYNSVKVMEKYQAAPTIQAPKHVDMSAIRADATEKLGDILFDHYKDNNQALARNVRERFFQELGYDPDKKIVSVSSSLEKVFNSFANYLKTGEYSYLKGNNNFLTGLQNRLLSCNVEC